MELRFSTTLNDIRVLKKNKYTKCEINLRTLWALPAEDWHMYAVTERNKSGFNELSTEQLFSTLKAYEFNIQRTKSSTKAGSSEEELPAPSKGDALKAAVKEKKIEKGECSSTDIQAQLTFMDERFSNMESKLKNTTGTRRRTAKEETTRTSIDHPGVEAKTTSLHKLIKDVECFGCGKKGHYMTGCPELSHTKRKALCAKHDKKYERKKVVVAEE